MNNSPDSPTPETDKIEYEQDCNFEVSWEDHSRRLERQRDHLLELLRSLHNWVLAKASEHYNGCGLWIDVDAALNGETKRSDEEEEPCP